MRLYEVKAAKLNLRAGPGTEHEIYEILTKGQLLYPLEDWLPVVLEGDGGVGWVSMQHVMEVRRRSSLKRELEKLIEHLARDHSHARIINAVRD